MKKISPGSTVTVKIVKTPTNAAATKTLVRLLSKDKTNRTEDKRLTRTRKRHYAPRPRGGRLYGGRMVKLRRIKGEAGESGTLHATVDVIADLQSVEQFVEVS